MSQAELFEPAEYLQPRGQPGTFSLLQRREGKVTQDSWSLGQLPEVVQAVDPRFDTWITQATFVTNNRRAVNLRDVGLLFVDLDTYRCAGLRDKAPEDQAALLAAFCRTEGLPAPSMVLFSGRGLQAKWLLREAQDPATLFEWNETQRALVRLLEPFSADNAAKDISRVLRLDQTVNTKSGRRCRVVWTASGDDAAPARYDFEDLREALVDQDDHEQRSRPTADRKPLALPQETNLRRLAWFRLYDLRDLWQMRGGAVDGYRELTLFWQLCFLVRAQPGKAADLWKEAQALAAQIAPGEQFYRSSDLGTLYRKARAASHGEVVEYHGKLYPPVYTPRNRTLLELFKITSDEQQHLRTIIDRNEKLRRLRARRQEAGVQPRPSRSDKPWEREGVSRRTWYYRQAAEDGTPPGSNQLELIGTEPLHKSKNIQCNALVDNSTELSEKKGDAQGALVEGLASAYRRRYATQLAAGDVEARSVLQSLRAGGPVAQRVRVALAATYSPGWLLHGFEHYLTCSDGKLSERRHPAAWYLDQLEQWVPAASDTELAEHERRKTEGEMPFPSLEILSRGDDDQTAQLLRRGRDDAIRAAMRDGYSDERAAALADQVEAELHRRLAAGRS